MYANRSYKKIVKTGFQNFCDATSFHGYNELYYSKTKFWRIIWLIVVSGAMGVTCYQIYKAVNTYMDQSKVTIIKPVDIGALAYPPLDVCYVHWITWLDWEKVQALNFTKETILFALSYLKAIHSSSIFDVEEARKMMIATMNVNNITRLSNLFKMVAKPIPMVMSLLGGGFLYDQPPFFNNITFRKNNDDIYLCYRLSGDEIVQILKDNKNSSDLLHSERMVLNFSLQDPNYSMYTSFLDYGEYNYRVGRWLSQKTNYWLTSLADYQKNYTAFTFPMRIFPDANSDKYVEITKENDEYDIDLTPTVHRQMNTPKSPCVEGAKGISTEHHCEDICQATMLKKLHKCLTLEYAILLDVDTPEQMCPIEISFLSDIFNQTSIRESQTNHNLLVVSTTLVSDTSLDSHQIKTEYKSCSGACSTPCEIWKYSYAKSITTLAVEARILSFKNQTDIRITYPEESDVLIMIDADARTWEDFIGNVGGLLGVWTGASIISFFEAIYLCFCKESSCSCNKINVIKPNTAETQTCVHNDHIHSSSAKATSANLRTMTIRSPPLPPI